jgi:hypothetical protein
VKPNFKNSNFSKEEFSDTSPVPKTLFILFINRSSRVRLPNAMLQKAFPCEGRGTACGGWVVRDIIDLKAK